MGRELERFDENTVRFGAARVVSKTLTVGRVETPSSGIRASFGFVFADLAPSLILGVFLA
jgi:hypothetical protein